MVWYIQSVIDANGDDRYRFTPLAEVVDRYALSYNNVERYPMCGVVNTTSYNKVTKVDVTARFA